MKHFRKLQIMHMEMIICNLQQMHGMPTITEITDNDIKHDKFAKEKTFPFLCDDLSWEDNLDLRFDTPSKEDQKLKCFNADSSHHSPIKKNAPDAVFKRSTLLTTMAEHDKDMKLDESHPCHFNALKKA